MNKSNMNIYEERVELESIESFENYYLNVLSFCLRRIGLSTKSLRIENKNDQDIESILEFNSIVNRKIKFNQYKLILDEKNIVIGNLAVDNTPIALYQYRGQDYIYYGSTNKSEKYFSELEINQNIFEVYPSFQSELKSIFDVMKFALNIEKTTYITFVIISLIVSLITLTVPIFTNYLIGTVLPQSNVKLLLELIIVLSIIGVGSFVANYLQSQMVLKIETLADIRLQTAIWDKLFKLPILFLSKYRTGDLSMRVNAVSSLRTLLSNSIVTILISTIFSVNFLVLMFYYEPSIAIWGLALSIVNCIIFLIFIQNNIKYQRPLYDSSASLQNFLITCFAGFSQIKSTQSEQTILSVIINKVKNNSILTLNSSFYSNAIVIYGLLLSPMAAILAFGLLVINVNSDPSLILNSQLLVNFISFYAAYSAFNGSLTTFASNIGGSIALARVLWDKAKPIY